MKTTASRHGSRSAHDGSDGSGTISAQPILEQRSRETQEFGSIVEMPIGLDEDVRRQSIEALNQLLADTLALRDLYKKCHWQVSGPTFYQLHLLFDKHYAEQVELVDLLAERVQTLGGVSIAMAHDVVEQTRLQRPPKGREAPLAQITRLVEAHRIILEGARVAAHEADERGDDATNDVLVSDIIRTNELQSWFLSEHLVEVPLLHKGTRE